MKIFYVACISAAFIAACLAIPASETTEKKSTANHSIYNIDSNLQLRVIDIEVLNDTDFQLRQLDEYSRSNEYSESWSKTNIILPGGSTVILPAFGDGISFSSFSSYGTRQKRKIVKLSTSTGYELNVNCDGFEQTIAQFSLTIKTEQNVKQIQRYIHNNNEAIMEKTHSRTVELDLVYINFFKPKIECRISSKIITPISTTSTTTVTAPVNTCRCGIRQGSTRRIVGGEITDRREFPWQVGLVRKFSSTAYAGPICGGTIVSAHHIITAAHCTVNRTRFNFAIHYGSDTRQLTRESLVDVSEVFDHPDYINAGQQPHNDISVLRLSKPLTFTDDVSPACLPATGTDFAGKTATVTGWGHTSYGGTASNDMRKVSLPIISNSECLQETGNRLLQPETKLCTAAIYGKDSCQGDSGGPLVVDNEGNNELVGVVSFGMQCAAGFPGFYTRITSYLQWINDVIGNDSFCGR